MTDRDLDRLSNTLFESWGIKSATDFERDESALNQSRKILTSKQDLPDNNIFLEEKSSAVPITRSISLAEAVMEARQSCMMKYLVGAATVVYGIPIYVH